VLSPPGVEGASLPTSAPHVQDKGKSPMHDEGLSGEQETDFILIHDDDIDMAWKVPNLERSSRSSRQRSKPYPSTWIGLSGILNIWSKGISSLKISKRLWKYKTSGRIVKLPKGGG